MSMYDLEEDRLLAEITGRGARRLLIQLPDGLKNEGPRLASLVRERTGADVFVSASSAWGACDLSLDAAARLKADMLVHYGHNEFLRDGSNGIPVVYIPAKSRHEIIPVVEKALPLLQGTRVGLATVVQHLHNLPETTKFLEEKGFKVQLPGRGPWSHETGQVLGLEKPTILADPYDKTVQSLDQDRARIIRQRYAMVEKARQASNFGIIISTKPGQSNPTIALNIQHQLEENGKKAVLLYADEIRPEKLLDFTDVDAFVDTACPRLALDDPERFPKPIVTRDEIMVVMGAWTWEQLLERGLVRL